MVFNNIFSENRQISLKIINDQQIRLKKPTTSCLRIINSKFFEKRQNSLKIIKQQQIR
jgi:hypothetical protein